MVYSCKDEKKRINHFVNINKKVERKDNNLAYRRNRKSKYGNKKTTIGNEKYDSRKEARRYLELKRLEEQGEISELRKQVKFELIPKQDGERAVRYYADFTYIQNGELVVEDVKSPVTRENGVYIIKRKLMLYKHGIRIKEI